MEAVLFFLSLIMLFFSYVSFHFYRKKIHNAFKFWGVSWLSVSLWVFLHTLETITAKEIIPLFVILALALISVYFLILGTYSWAQKKAGIIENALFVVTAVWLAVGFSFGINIKITSSIFYLIIGGLTLYCGIIFLKQRKGAAIGVYVAGISLILWGINRIVYPFFTNYKTLANWAYSFSMFLFVTTSLGIFLSFFEKSRFDLIDSIKEEILAKEALAENVMRLKRKNKEIGRTKFELETAYDKVKKSELFFKAVFEQTFQFVGVLTPDGYVIDVNKNALDFAGVTIDEVKGKYFPHTPWWNFSGKEMNKIKQAINKAGKGIKSNFYANHIRNSDEKKISVSVSTRPIYDENGEVIYIVAEGRNITEIKNANEEMLKTKNKLELATSSGNIHLWEYDKKADKFSVSANFIRTLGYSADIKEDFTNNIQKYIHEDDYKILKNELEYCLSCKQCVCEVELRIKNKHGGYNWFLFRGKNDNTVDEDINKLFGVFVDITNIKQIEILFKTIFTSSPIPVFISDLKTGMFIQVNPAGTQFFGYKETEMLGRSSAELKIWGNPEKRDEFIQELKGKNNIKNYEIEFKNKDGKKLKALLSSAIFELFGKDKIITILIDITEKKELEKSIDQQKNLLQTIYNSFPDLLAYADTEFNIKMVNISYLEWIGLTEDEIINKNIKEIFQEKVAKQIEKEYGRVMKTGILEERITKLYPVGRNKHREYIIKTDKPHKWFYEIKNPVKNATGEVIGVISILRDVSALIETEIELQKAKTNLEQKVKERTKDLEEKMELLHNEILLRQKTENALIIAKEEAERSNKLKEEFLGYISHEIRTPLGLITMCTQSLTELQGISSNNKNIEQILKSVDNSIQIIDEVMDISQIESGRFNISKSIFDLEEIVNSVVSVFAFDLEHQDLKIINTTQKIKIFSDEKRIKQVLNNLISNAIKYSEQGEIKVKAQVKNNELVCSVTDTGIGISDENIDKIFEPLFREKTTDYKVKGMGLGLNICKKIIDNLNGKILVKSEKGKGSEFTFKIPIENINIRKKI